MNKKYMIPMIALLLVTTVLAGTIATNYIFGVKDVSDFTKEVQEVSPNEQTLKLTIDGKVVEVQGTEQDGKYDTNDVESLVSRYSVNGTITKVELVGTGTWKENKYGDKSFDAEELKSKECSHEGLTYDSELNDCMETEDVEEPIEIGEI